MADKVMTQEQQKQLQQLVEDCGLGLVLGGLANICAIKSADWDATLWRKAMNAIDVCADTPAVLAVS